MKNRAFVIIVCKYIYKSSKLLKRWRKVGKFWLFAMVFLAVSYLPRDAHALYVNKNLVDAPLPSTISVCWEPYDSTLGLSNVAAKRQWVRNIVESTWARYARIVFTGWDTCGSADVRIQVITGGTSNAFNATWYPGTSNGMKLAFSFNNQRDIEKYAVHEFGHVLGFYHEEERLDYSLAGFYYLDNNQNGINDLIEPDCQFQDQTGAWWGPSAQGQAMTYLGCYDVWSAMSYCGGTGHPDLLSPNDIAGLQTVYDRHLPGTLISPRAHCLSAHLNQGSGSQAFVWDCDEAGDDQEWAAYPPAGNWLDGFLLSLGSGAQKKCLTSEEVKSGSNVVLENCTNFHPEQDWMFEEVEIRGYGEMCLDLKGGNTAQGTQVQMWRCGELEGKNQKWTVMPNGIIKYGKATSNVCLSSQNGRVFVAPCGLSSVNQRFQLSKVGRIFEGNLLSNKCLDVCAVTHDQYVQGHGSIRNGQSVQIFECLDAQLNQRWSLRGTVKQTNTNLCLDRKWGADEAGTGVHLWNCDGNQAQIWEFYLGGTNPDSGIVFEDKVDVTQSITLSPGWNWVSFNVLPDDISLESFFGDHVDDIEQVKTQTRSATNLLPPGPGWIGDDLNLMSKISNNAMFKIKVRKEATPFTLNVTGLRLPSDMTIQLQQNWTWIAYLPGPDCLSVEEVVSSIMDVGDFFQIKSQTQSKTNIGGTSLNLIGDLVEVCPGQGYVVKMNAPGSLIYP